MKTYVLANFSDGQVTGVIQVDDPNFAPPTEQTVLDISELENINEVTENPRAYKVVNNQLVKNLKLQYI